MVDFPSVEQAGFAGVPCPNAERLRARAARTGSDVRNDMRIVYRQRGDGSEWFLGG